MADIRSRPSSPEYRQNFDLIFGPKRRPTFDDHVRAALRVDWSESDSHTESLDSHPQAD